MNRMIFLMGILPLALGKVVFPGRTSSSTPVDVCSLPPHTGNIQCAALIHKFTYDSAIGECVQYIYGGCHGTENLFNTRDECARRCQKHDVDICELPPIWGNITCLAASDMFTYDSTIGECVEYIYGGCHGTENLFNTKEECAKRCPRSIKAVKPGFCSSPPILPGTTKFCKALKYKWTFNAEKDRCESYVYGGCGATQNLFDTLGECVKICDPESVEPSKTSRVCSLPIIGGRCRGRKPAYGFNSATSRCELFIYGGCGGNGNRFSSVEECFNTCGGNEPNEETSLCSFVTCDKRELEFNTAKGCKPIVKPGECCPSSWDCSIWENQRLKKLDSCFYASPSNPKGRFYSHGDNVEDIPTCPPMAKCRTNLDGIGVFEVPAFSCGAFSSGPCISLYNSTDQCCPSTHICEAKTKSSPQDCEFEGKMYLEGEIMYSDVDPCLKCFCKPGFDEHHLEDNCEQVKCNFIHDQRELIHNCLPIYREDVCCPIDWACPLKKETFPLNANPSSELEMDTPILIPTMMTSISCPPGVKHNTHYVGDAVLIPQEAISRTASVHFVSNLDTSRVQKSVERSSDDCLLSQAQGPCLGFVDKFYFDSGTHGCKSFKYGDVDGNKPGQNVFNTLAECESVCSDYLIEAQDFSQDCQDPVGSTSSSSSLCLPLKKRFKFNSATGKCEPFTSGFCSPGKNRFDLLEECRLKCEAAQTPRLRSGTAPRCHLDSAPGNCKSRILRYFYNSKSGRCQQFYYKGCNGNANNFATLEKCLDTCVAPSGQNLRSSLSGPGSDPIVFPEPLGKVQDPCKQEKQVGPCKAEAIRYYYDSDSKTCRLFVYGGCQGNGNNFESLKSCVQTCKVDPSTQAMSKKHCALPFEKGTCYAIYDVWYFDPSKNDCRRAEYSGCDGNENRFDSNFKCRLSCMESTELDLIEKPRIPDSGADTSIVSSGLIDPCNLEKQEGSCNGDFKAFYFDKEAKECKPFVYGGCKGNGNNFGSKDICTEVCARHISPSPDGDEPFLPIIHSANGDLVPFDPSCMEPIDISTCRAKMPRFYFEAAVGECRKFVWGGCDANHNNFFTEEDCVRTCQPHVALPPPENRKCVFANQTYSVGDELVVDSTSCATCTCSSPPFLSCRADSCPDITPINTKGCKPKFDARGCCLIGYECDETIPCSERLCVEPGFVNPPGKKCEFILDHLGCCTRVILCTPNYF